MVDFKKLNFWIRAHHLVLSIYRDTASFPEDEKFGLKLQIRRAGVSVSSNIAEGSGRKSKKEFLYFLNIAIGSLSELHYQLILSRDLQYLSEKAFLVLEEEIILIRKMIFHYSQKIIHSC